MADRPLVCRACKEAMSDIAWNSPCKHWKETPEHVARIEAAIAARDREVEQARADRDHYKRRERELMDECDRRDVAIDEMKTVLEAVWRLYSELAQFADGMKIKARESWSDWDESVRNRLHVIGTVLDPLKAAKSAGEVERG